MLFRENTIENLSWVVPGDEMWHRAKAVNRTVRACALYDVLLADDLRSAIDRFKSNIPGEVHE